MKENPKTLLILAAGMGSRYGGIKQIDTFGPHGETIIDYTLYSALEIGFNKIVFVVRKNILENLKEIFLSKLKGKIQVEFVVQELSSCIGDFPLNPERKKPWGTAHAILVAKDKIHEPFVVVNADDFYGKNGLALAFNFMTKQCKKKEYALVGYNILTTLSTHGTVNRGICKTNAQNYLIEIKEHTNIAFKKNKVIVNDSEKEYTLDNDSLASMNLWIFHHTLFTYLEEYFKIFLKTKGAELKAEYFIPNVIDSFIHAKNGKVKVIPNTQDKCFGVTYKEDTLSVKDEIKKLVDAGIYPSPLWLN